MKTIQVPDTATLVSNEGEIRRMTTTIRCAQTWFVQVTVSRVQVSLQERTPHHIARNQADHLIEGVTAREWEVLELLSDGASNREIADELGISTRTVESHLSAVYGKLGVRGRSQAMLWAIEAGRPRERTLRPVRSGIHGYRVA
jgi:DNA-binding NarL/FixJ family response regulator